MIACGPVDELSNHVHMSGVTIGLLDHMNEYPSHRNGLSEPGRAYVVEVQLLDDSGRVPLLEAIEN